MGSYIFLVRFLFLSQRPAGSHFSIDMYENGSHIVRRPNASSCACREMFLVVYATVSIGVVKARGS